MTKNYKFLTFITIFFVTILLVSNIVSTKLVDLGIFIFDAGTLLFPLSYIFSDVLTEVYGYKETRKVIWMGFVSTILLSAIIIIVGILPGASERTYQADYNNILGLTPRIVTASLIAYLFGEFSNSYIMAKVKIKMQGKMLWVRTIGSTIIGEFFDTIIFVLIAFAGIYDNELIKNIIISNYVFKVGVEILFTPITYIIINKLKKSEQEDYYDNKTNFNPIKL
ncbi:MAG: queuosine precursor transporter [Candidatus Gracilibacteria bacterium]|nr:queuosine precursor transporter [Candidatus Gracilibacteria bacterium]